MNCSVMFLKNRKKNPKKHSQTTCHKRFFQLMPYELQPQECFLFSYSNEYKALSGKPTATGQCEKELQIY